MTYEELQTSFNSLMAKTAEYVATVQPENDRLHGEVAKLKADMAKVAEKQAEADSTFAKRATQTAGVLVHRGLIDQADVNGFVDKVAADHSAVWELVEKLASAVGADSLGDKSHDTISTAGTGDPWYDTFFGKTSHSSIY